MAPKKRRAESVSILASSAACFSWYFAGPSSSDARALRLWWESRRKTPQHLCYGSHKLAEILSWNANIISHVYRSRIGSATHAPNATAIDVPGHHSGLKRES